MGIFGDFGNPTFGLRDLKIATWNSAANYGTAVDIPSAQLYEVSPETVSAELEGDDVITATHAFAISATVRIRFGSVPLEVLQILTGNTYDSYGTTPSRIRSLVIDAISFPYFGICGKALSTEDSGDMHIFVPKLKVMDGFTIGFQYGQFTIPEITCKAVPGINNKIVEYILHETAANVALPPVYS
jgi:hypothetical protein